MHLIRSAFEYLLVAQKINTPILSILCVYFVPSVEKRLSVSLNSCVFILTLPTSLYTVRLQRLELKFVGNVSIL